MCLLYRKKKQTKTKLQFRKMNYPTKKPMDKVVS